MQFAVLECDAQTQCNARVLSAAFDCALTKLSEGTRANFVRRRASTCLAHRYAQGIFNCIFADSVSVAVRVRHRRDPCQPFVSSFSCRRATRRRGVTSMLSSIYAFVECEAMLDDSMMDTRFRMIFQRFEMDDCCAARGHLPDGCPCDGWDR